VPADSVCVVLIPNRILAIPQGRLPYFPVGPNLREPPEEPFIDLEEQEYVAPKLARALEIAGPLAASPDPLVRAGALLRKARILRKLNRPADALRTYELLCRIPTVANDGVPFDLVARKARCSVFGEHAQHVELRREAEALAADLRSGKWQLDQSTYELAAGQLSGWLGKKISASAQQEALAAGVDRLSNAGRTHRRAALHPQAAISSRRAAPRSPFCGYPSQAASRRWLQAQITCAITGWISCGGLCSHHRRGWLQPTEDRLPESLCRRVFPER